MSAVSLLPSGPRPVSAARRCSFPPERRYLRHRPHRTRLLSQERRIRAGRQSRPRCSSPAYRRFQVTGDA